MNHRPWTIVHGLWSYLIIGGNSMTQLQGFFWFIVMLIPLILLQRLLHREIQAVFLIITRSPQLTMGVFSFIFLPGVFLHELSHFLLAKILRVPTGRFSIFPQPLPDGRL